MRLTKKVSCLDLNLNCQNIPAKKQVSRLKSLKCPQLQPPPDRQQWAAPADLPQDPDQVRIRSQVTILSGGRPRRAELSGGGRKSPEGQHWLRGAAPCHQ